jgi:TolB-like protein/DNA-binding winged helix-turn-helix (wHTH) protein/Flp pilus assembly protein TadD
MGRTIPVRGCGSGRHSNPAVTLWGNIMTPMAQGIAGRVRLGGFELDLRSGELRLAGTANGDGKVVLREQPFQILRMLIESGAKILTREEIKRKLWPDDTTVDFDHSINVAIGVLRRALGDSANNPQYIETFGRRGYRLLVATEHVETSAETPSVESAATQPLPRRARLIGGSRWRIAAVLVSVAVILLVAGYISWRRFLAVPPPTSEKIMLAVLPFQNLTGDPQKEYLADGLTEEMIAELGRLHPEQLGVIARTSVMGYKHSNQRLDQIGRDLSVQYVLENSLRASGDHLRVTVQLLQVKDQSHLWSHDYDYRPRDILSLEEDVAKAVAREIQIRLTPQQHANLTRVRPVNSEAFEAYLEGRYFLQRDGNGDLNRAQSSYEQAIKLDPGYAPAWAGLSQARFRQADRGFVHLDAGQREARAAAERALVLDPNLAEAHAQMGRIKMFVDWDWMGANASLQRALALDPGNPAVVSFASLLAASLGRFDEALELARRAIAFDPLNAMSRAWLAHICFVMGRQAEAEVDFKKTLELNPDLPGQHEWLGFVYLAQGRSQNALAEMERERATELRLQGYAVVYYALGQKKESDSALSELITTYRADSAFQIAGVYAFRNEPDKAFEWLDRAYVQRDAGLAVTKFERLLKNLHSDPRYIAFLKKLRLPL